MFALTVVNYLLGKNPQGRSYMVGFGNNPVLRPQHAAAMGPYAGLAHFADPEHFRTRWRHTLYGAIVGGPNDQDQWSEAVVGQMPAGIISEPALEFSAAVPGLMAMLFRSWGGAPLPQFPPPEVPAAGDDEVFAEAALSNDGRHLKIWINNRSAWPPNVRDRLSARYFIALEPGQTVDDVKISVVASECVQPVAPRAVAWRDRLAYIEIDCGGTPIFPGGSEAGRGERFRKRTELRISAPVWDASNDPSFDLGLVTETDTARKTDRIAVFDQQRRLYGRIP